MKIHLSDDGKLIISVEIEGGLWPLKEPMPVDKLPELTTHLGYVLEHFAILAGQKITYDELKDLIDEFTEKQRFFVSTLSEAGDWIPLHKAIEEHSKKFGGKATGLTIGGLQAHMTMRCEKRKKEQFWEVDYRESEDENYYRIKPEYESMIINILKEAS